MALLQEIKSVDESFPRDLVEERGYRVETHGQKSFNGVAILSRLPLEDVTRGLPGDEADEQARWIEATVIGERRAVRVCGLYLPNGNPAPGPKYDYKLRWMERLRARAADLLAAEEPALMAGDYNVIPQAEDAARPQAWVNDALFLPQTREAFRRVVNLGFTEAFRAQVHGPGHYSFWDYQAGAWDRNDGIRIDHHLLTRRRRTCCGIAGSSGTCGRARSRRTMCRSGWSWTPEGGGRGTAVPRPPARRGLLAPSRTSPALWGQPRTPENFARQRRRDLPLPGGQDWDRIGGSAERTIRCPSRTALPNFCPRSPPGGATCMNTRKSCSRRTGLRPPWPRSCAPLAVTKWSRGSGARAWWG